MENSILYYMGAAFLGGVILNVMPCVLPVLTMKVFHVIEKAKEDPSINRKHGLAYSAGIMVMFWAFAAIVMVLRASGDRMGWGMQFQSPAFVAVMTALMVAFGLNALGVFEIALGMGDVQTGEGYGGTFINGVLASIMSTPCSAPFLGAAATFALGSGATWWQTLLMFTFIGLGLAFPFLLISFVPAIGRRLPRPGAWMETFKQLMGFTLLAAAVWLFGTLQSQLTKSAVHMFLGFLLVMSLALWALERFGGLAHGNLRRRIVQLLAAATTGAAAYFMVDLAPAPKDAATEAAARGARPGEHPAVKDGKINWASFDPPLVQAALQRGQPVFMDYTADWCANCKTNEQLFIETKQIHQDLENTSILPMKADWTTEDETIESWMNKLGRSGLPIYVVYYPDGSHDLLPELITTQMLSDALKKASEKYPPSKFAAAAEAATKATTPEADDANGQPETKTARAGEQP